MSLVDFMMENFTILNKVKEADGEGGYITSWSDGPTIRAALVLDTTIAARIAESEGLKNVYTITTSRSNPLEFHDVVRRDSDGAIFRVTSDGTEKKTPSVSSLDLLQATAERWELT